MTRQLRACPRPSIARPANAARRACRPQPLVTAALLLSLLWLPGCQVMVGGERTVAEENDRLRRQNLELTRQNEALEDRVASLERRNENLSERLERSDDGPAIEGVEPPRLDRLSFSRLSGGVDLDGDERDDIIRIYLQTQDQQGRVIPVAGRVTLRAVHLPSEGEPRTVVKRAYSPDELDAAWRHSFTGIHYTLELPLPDTLSEDVAELTVYVSLLEAQSGVRFDRQQAIDIQR